MTFISNYTALLFIFLLIGCTQPSNTKKLNIYSNTTIHVIDFNYNNSYYAIKSGDFLRILLPLESDGYKWELDKSSQNSNVVNFLTKGYFINGNPSKPYSSSQEAKYLTFIFQALKEGESTIIIDYLNINNKKTKTMKVNIKVNK